MGGVSIGNTNLKPDASRYTIDLMQRSDWYSDTDPRALEVFFDCLRRMTASEKVHGILQLNRMVFETARAEVRRQHPDLSDHEVFLRTAARHLDRETMIRVYEWDPESASA
jgi:hypothetical protein